VDYASVERRGGNKQPSGEAEDDARGDRAVMSEPDLRPNPTLLLGSIGAIAVVSAASLPWHVAIASIMLGSLMAAAAEIDARTCLLPDVTTLGAVAVGILAAPMLNPFDPWISLSVAIAQAAGAACALALLRWGYAGLRRREGIGFGDVKLAAAVGAWLPLDAIPWCFGLAASAALITVIGARLRGRSITGALRVPFGAFLCPALWLFFYASVLPS
jgi:leader peptidase (prepilin peptidase) / N-methyltransferase